MAIRADALLLFIVSMLLPAAGHAELQATDLIEVAISRSPGKAHARFDLERPAEEIAAGATGDGAWIEVRINVRREGVDQFTAERVTLSRSEWGRLAKIVRDDGLLEWTPETGMPPRGWGTGGFTIVDAERREWTWKALPPNADALAGLTRALLELAQQKLPGVVLHYIHPLD